MLLTFGIVLALSMYRCVDCLTCLQCTDIESPRHCKHVTECPSGKVCYIQKTTSRYGEVLFDLGCTDTATCSNRSHGNHTCGLCCSSSLCNAAGCGQQGFPSSRGPICYSCSAQTTEGSCPRIEFCNSNEVCMLREQREFDDTVYTSQCAMATHCEDLKLDVASIIGRSILEDTRSLTETTCHKCCHGDLCNAQCYTKVDYCTSSPCVHGRCVNGMTGYTCVCDPTYIGQNCSAMNDCKEIRLVTNISGVYSVRPEGTHADVEVYCDMTTDGGGWTVFQRRMNGSVDFDQHFTSYENGFGNVYAEFWLGLKYISAMTYNEHTELRIDVVAADGSTAYEVYQNFNISASSNYTLHIDRGHGNASDDRGLSFNNGFMFYTYDNADPLFCARTYHAGWWFHASGCFNVNLNGQYFTPGTTGTGGNAGVVYNNFKGWESLKETKMMLRRV